ncbi:MAG: hypothetical protein O7H41_15605 [Planctomycetota bacterium]|nr:hypothetical protein [Planctomycetota bacterium]
MASPDEPAAFEYPARRGDTLPLLAEEFGCRLARIQDLNPDLPAEALLSPGRLVKLPWRGVDVRLRVDPGGQRLVHSSSLLQVAFDAGWFGTPILPVFTHDKDRKLRMRFLVDRRPAVGEGVVDGLVFLAPEGADLFGSLPVRAYAGDGSRPMLGGEKTSPLPPLDEIRKHVEHAGGRILRTYAERGLAGRRRLSVAFNIDPREILNALPESGRVRLWAFCSDGYSCDADRSDALGILRLLIEYRTRSSQDGKTRCDLEAAGSGGEFREVEPMQFGEERVQDQDGEEWVEVLPCPDAHRVRVTGCRAGPLRECVRDGELVLVPSEERVSTERQTLSVEVYCREGTDSQRIHRIIPDRKEIDPDEYESAKRRIDLETNRLVLLLEMTGEGIRLAEGWLDGENMFSREA